MINCNECTLSIGPDTIKMKSDKEIFVNRILVSLTPNKLDTIESIEILGNNSTIFSILNFEYKNTEPEIIINNDPDRTRLKLADELSSKYKSHIYSRQSAKRLLIPRICLFVTMFAFIGLLLCKFKIRKVSNIALLLYLFIIVIDMYWGGIILSFSFL